MIGHISVEFSERVRVKIMAVARSVTTRGIRKRKTTTAVANLAPGELVIFVNRGDDMLEVRGSISGESKLEIET